MHVIPQSWPHLHMLASVFPPFGLLFVLGFYIAGLRAKNEGVKRTCLFLVAMLALLSIPIYLSGDGARAQLSSNVKFPKDVMAAHASWGIAALIALAITGLAALIELVRTRGAGRAFSDRGYLTFALALISLALTAWVGELGLGIDHRELASTVVIPDVSTSPIWPHVHIILNHVPTAGFVFALFFFLVALVTNNDLMKQCSLVLFVICAVIGVPTYVSGTASMWALTQPPTPEISKAVINAHRDMALWTLFGLALTGSASWIELWRYPYSGRFSKLSLATVLVLALATLAIMTETGHRGGLINHPEIRTAADVLPVDPNVGVSMNAEQEMHDLTLFTFWQIVHFFGYCLIFGTLTAVMLRVLGLWKSVSFAAVHRLLPLAFLGLLMNVVSGMLMMLADSYRYVVSDVMFAPKIALIPIAAIAVLYFSVSARLWSVKAGDATPATAKWVAVVTLLAWAGVIACGRLLPFV
jgi:uncharacterized membrane protein